MTDQLFSDRTGNNILSLLEQREHPTTADERGLFIKYYYNFTLAPGDIHPAEDDNSVPIWCMIGLIVVVIFLFRGVCMGPPAQILPVVGIVVHEEENDTPPKPKKKREDPEIRRKRILKAFDVNQVTLVRSDIPQNANTPTRTTTAKCPLLTCPEISQ
jgi:hypothetical protein